MNAGKLVPGRARKVGTRKSLTLMLGVFVSEVTEVWRYKLDDRIGVQSWKEGLALSSLDRTTGLQSSSLG